ncbi:biotin transporter BioY [Propionicicella superfundia]|uniref:biotin transporter BioY n=1 Tax=Propionicicella superfundia TaxID=348582 RepID=UPI0003FF08D9|nr:biotin transporter BioY [Propionicicella superfundia]
MAQTGTPSAATDVALIAVFAALISASSLITIGGAVPLTLQTLGVILTGLVLGPWRGLLATSLYLVMGFANLPVFAGGRSGLSVLAGPTAGYLLSFPLAALVAGLVAAWAARRGSSLLFVWFLVGGALATVLTHAIGVAWWSTLPNWTFAKAFAADLVFWPGDIVKLVIAAGVAVGVHKAFPALLGSRERRRTAAGPAAA